MGNWRDKNTYHSADFRRNDNTDRKSYLPGGGARLFLAGAGHGAVKIGKIDTAAILLYAAVDLHGVRSSLV